MGKVQTERIKEELEHSIDVEKREGGSEKSSPIGRPGKTPVGNFLPNKADSKPINA